MNIIKLYIWLCDLPLRQSMVIIIGTGFIIAVFFPLLPLAIKDWVVMIIENNWK